ncbi:MAG TPA: hypothetical protein VE944_00930 [Nostoc sp.]|nr:hypothetical protein [Nostoc sp.]HYX12936.1 hypothetical protein [Nostoc sp.]
MRISDVYDGLRQRTTSEFSRRGDRLYEGNCKEAMSMTGYANAPHLI